MVGFLLLTRNIPALKAFLTGESTTIKFANLLVPKSVHRHNFCTLQELYLILVSLICIYLVQNEWRSIHARREKLCPHHG